MKSTLLILVSLLIFCTARSQSRPEIWQNAPNSWWHNKGSLSVDSLLGIPKDTLRPSGNQLNYPQVAIKTDTLYYWSIVSAKWKKVSVVIDSSLYATHWWAANYSDTAGQRKYVRKDSLINYPIWAFSPLHIAYDSVHNNLPDSIFIDTARHGVMGVLLGSDFDNFTLAYNKSDTSFTVSNFIFTSHKHDGTTISVALPQYSAGLGLGLNTTQFFLDTTLSGTKNSRSKALDSLKSIILANGVNLTQNFIGVGNGSNLLSGAANFQFNGTTQTIGTITTLSSTATPVNIDLGSTVTNSAGSHLKINLFDDGTNRYGFGVSVGTLDYVITDNVSDHVFYTNGSQRLRIANSGVVTAYNYTGTGTTLAAFDNNGSWVRTSTVASSVMTGLTVLNNGTSISSRPKLNIIASSPLSASIVDNSGSNQIDVTLSTTAMVSPMTTLGDIIYENGTPTAARLAGNTTSTKKILTQTGTGSVSAAPIWDVLVAGDIPNIAESQVTSLTTDLAARLQNITGYITNGTNITITGSGTLASPYNIAATTGGAGLSSAYTSIKDGTTTAAASGSDVIWYRSANNLLTTTVTNNDGTFGDNLLLTVNQANFVLTESQITSLVSDLALKAPLASPTFTGTPAAPTASAGTNTTQLATTAFTTGGINTAVSGTTSVVAEFTGTNAVGNSAITHYSPGGVARYGIGTGSPAATFVVESVEGVDLLRLQRTGVKKFGVGNDGTMYDANLDDGTTTARMLTVTNGVFGYQTITAAGEDNTESNITPTVNTSITGAFYKQKSGVDLQIRELTAPTNAGIALSTLTNEVQINDNEWNFKNQVIFTNPTDALTHNVQLITLPSTNCTVEVKLDVVQLGSSNSVGGYVVTYLFSKISGTVTLINTSVTLSNLVASTSITTAASGGNIQISCVGSISQTIWWTFGIRSINIVPQS